MAKGMYIPSSIRGKSKATVLKNRRETLYKMISKKNGGNVPCFVCGKHVTKELASLEHIIKRANGGTDEMSNLSISHIKCNNERGD